jgi:hypothetical protein
MTDKTDDLPEVFRRDSHVIAAARKGMRMRSIAARAGKKLKDLEALLFSDPEFALKVEQAYADFEEEKRDRIEAIERKAEAENELSLLYKINREAIKELADRDNATRSMQVVVSQNSLPPEPEYVELDDEELAAIRAETEANDGQDADDSGDEE